MRSAVARDGDVECALCVFCNKNGVPLRMRRVIRFVPEDHITPGGFEHAGCNVLVPKAVEASFGHGGKAVVCDEKSAGLHDRSLT